jgi:pyruvyltransferase
MRLRYYDRARNFGDLLAVEIVRLLAPEEEIEEAGLEVKGRAFTGLGSILASAREGDAIFCTGLWKSTQRLKSRALKIFAVRGPLTAQWLRSMGLNPPALYGDPLFFLPFVYEPKPIKSKRVLAPHFNDGSLAGMLSDMGDYYDHNLDLRNGDVFSNLDKIIGAEFVTTSSLHVAIVCDVYGIPCVVHEAPRESKFKYQDYFLGSGRGFESGALVKPWRPKLVLFDLYAAFDRALEYLGANHRGIS